MVSLTFNFRFDILSFVSTERVFRIARVDCQARKTYKILKTDLNLACVKGRVAVRFYTFLMRHAGSAPHRLSQILNL
jgi:hypothetical protein